MPEILKTPGVYISEKDSGSNNVVQVPTAVPVFIGYSEKAEINGKSFSGKPVHITCFSDYENFFGIAPKPVFSIKEFSGKESLYSLKINNKSYILEQNDNTNFMMYYSIKLFFDNGGADCYVISIGQYGESNHQNLEISPDHFKKAIDKLSEEESPTMIVMPDSLLLDEEDGSYYNVQSYALLHCAKYMNKITLCDIWGGDKELLDEEKNKYIERFRENIGMEGLTYGAAYFPWIHSNVISLNSIGFEFFDLESLQKIIKDEHKSILANIKKSETIKEKKYWDSGLKSSSKEYKIVRKLVCDKINLLPACPAIAGLYTRTDKARGVWIAPANQNLNSVLSPAIKITHEDQENLNIDALSGKSINAIRTFKGKGSAIVWGARTLAGNSEEWKYINVRRLFILIEQSIKNAANSVIFKPNVSVTWAIVKSSINGFLSNLWRQGALVGNSTNEAFEVKCGLGSTMNESDILDGIMRIQVKVAPSRPAEFIVITFEQKLGGQN